jgi:hypothetical protein
MHEQVIFIGTFRIPDRETWEPAVARMRAFVEANVLRVRFFHAYAETDGDEGTVIYGHPDAASLDEHLAAAAQLIREGSEMVEITGIQFLGAPNPATVERLRASGLPVSVKAHVTGFERLG